MVKTIFVVRQMHSLVHYPMFIFERVRDMYFHQFHGVLLLLVLLSLFLISIILFLCICFVYIEASVFE